MRKTVKTVLITFVATVLLIAVATVVLFLKVDFPYKKFLQVVSRIESSYVEEYDRAQSEENAINAVIDSLGDKYAAYYNEDNVDDILSIIEGFYVGIGAEVSPNTEQKRIEIMAVIKGSPAEKAGIKAGDFIKSIDGKDYSDEDVDDSVSYLKGIGIEDPLEKSVEITLIRGSEEYTVSLKREEVNRYVVSSQTIDDICYIELGGFTESTHWEVFEITQNLSDSVKGVVIDLRDNPGGSLDSLRDICDIFMEKETIMYTIDKDGDKEFLMAQDGSIDTPLAVIVNGNTASASEVFAGAMKAHKRAVIVGEKTFGKGVTQSVFSLKPLDYSEGVLKLTTYKNYTPDGIWINEGITPDVEVPAPTVEGDITEDPAFIEAVKSLKKDK